MRACGTAVALVAISIVAEGGVKADTIIDLGPGLATAINASGQVVGYSYSDTSDPTTSAFLYSGGVSSSLGTFGGTSAVALGINDSGQIVGYLDVAGSGAQAAFLYSGGVTTILATGYAYAAGINDSGQVVGSSCAAVCSNLTAFLYSGGVLTDLDGAIGGTGGHTALAISNSGQIAGTYPQNGNDSAYLYSGGVTTNLGISGFPASINNSGQVVGWQYTNGNPNLGESAFLYSSGVVTNLGNFSPFGLTQALGINDPGEIVGTSTAVSGGQDAFLYYGGIMTDLNSLLPANSGWRLEYATAINDSGQIVGYGFGPDGRQDAFLLDTGSSVPEPASLVLFGSGAALLVLMRKKISPSAKVGTPEHGYPASLGAMIFRRR